MSIAVVNSGTSTSGALGFTATAGRLVLCALGVRNWAVTWNSDGVWTLLQKWDNNTTNNEPPIFLFGKVAAGGETAVGGSFNNDAGRAAVAIEVTGATLTGAGGTAAKSANGGGSPVTPSITPPASNMLIVGAADAKFSMSAPGAPWSMVGTVAQGGSQWPFMAMVYQIVTPASGSYSVGLTAGTEWWSAVNAYIPEVAPATVGSAHVILGGGLFAELPERIRRLWSPGWQRRPSGVMVPC